MKILVVGKGGREHALVQALRGSPSRPNVFAYPGSDAMTDIAQNIGVGPAGDIVLEMKKRRIDFCIVGEEQYLAEGLANRCRDAGIPVWGPGREGARLESSKIFAKEFMRRHRVPTADFGVAGTPREVRALVRSYPVVLKFDGLAGGKGVSVCFSEKDVDLFIEKVFEKGQFGETHAVVVEDHLVGNEVSIICSVVDGEYHIFVPARDYKRLQDGDRGPNTGGMGAVASAEFVPMPLIEEIEQSIIQPVMDGLAKESLPYRGFLYFGLMLTMEGPKVLEFNCRFGDPEAEAVFPLMKGDVAEYLFSAAKGESDAGRRPSISFDPGWSVCVVMASRHYPGRSSSGEDIIGLAGVKNARLYHSGTARRENGGFTVNGGRVLCVAATGPDRKTAVRRVYREVRKIRFDGMQYRTDIGTLHFEEQACPAELAGIAAKGEQT